jgi:peroxiredoxin
LRNPVKDTHVPKGGTKMRRKQIAKALSLVVFMVLSLTCSLVYSAESMKPGSTIPEFNLRSPDSNAVKAYLGLKDEKSFSLPQIKAKLMVVEFFDVFCPVCQKNAPMVNRLFKYIREDKELDKDVKMMGIALEGQPDDLSAYKQKFKVEFPLFSDPGKKIQSKLKINYVPIIVVVDKNGKILLNHVGLLENVDTVLTEIRKKAQTL